MPRVTFARSKKPIDEHSPLLRPISSLPTLGEENEESGNDGSKFPDTPKSPQRKSRRGILTVSRSSSEGSFTGDRSYLPLHRRRTLYAPNDVPVWKTVLTVVCAIILLGCIIAATVLLDIVQHPTGPYPAPPSTPTKGVSGDRNEAFLIKATNGAVATENEVCSNIGVEILKAGGNAVDAAIAATFCIGVVNLFSSGIGGGGFMTVRLPPSPSEPTSQIWTIDFRETAPAKSNTTMYANDPYSSKFGGLSIGVPGEVRGLEEAHKRWGSMPWRKLVQPSIDLASGWTVGKELGRRIPWYSELILGNPVWKAIFAPNGTFLQTGELIRRTNYSRTLNAIANEGSDAFYKGPVANAMINMVQATGGIMTLEDLESYKVKVAPALVGTYLGRKVHTSHAPTSGPILLHMLNLLERFDLAGEGRTPLNTHRLVEVLKFGFAARTKLCDPNFTNDTARINEIPTKSFGRLISANITDERTHPPEYYNPVYDVPIDHGTSHTSVVDKNGMAVALTSTVNLVFGSQVMDPVTGVLFNDEMDDFSTPGIPNAFGLWPSPYNYPEPFKRPLSSTAPTIIEHEDGSFYFAVGASGGSRIFGAILQVILGVDQWGVDVSQAIEWGRVHDQLYPLIVDVDDVISEDTINTLKEKGHNVTVSDVNRVAAVVQAVMKIGDTIYAASDSRKNGIAAGY